MSISVIWHWQRSSLQPASTTIDDLQNKSRHYRHPDSATVAYPVIVAAPLGELPPRDHHIAIVGAGAAGISALYELAQLSRTLPAPFQLNVTVFENDPDHFLAAGSQAVDVKGRKAGRVSAARVSAPGEDGTHERSVYEVGAMRFPEIAGLTWHYASRVYAPDTLVNVFPNPGKVATEFVFADRVDRYENTEWLDKESPTRKVLGLVLRFLPGYNHDSQELSGESLYKIGGIDPAVVSVELGDPATLPSRLLQIENDWQAFVARHDSTPLAGAIRAIMEHAAQLGELPLIEGLDPQERIQYCVELFGRFGFGTGGFKPLYNLSMVEMMRLILWDYSNEYTLPVEENVQFLAGLYRKAVEAGQGRLNVNFESARVSDACHQTAPDNGLARRAQLFYYRNGLTNPALLDATFDYVVLAMPQDQLTPVVRRSGSEPLAPQLTRLGDHGLGLASRLVPQVYPALQLSRTSSAPTARLVSAISQLHMARSAKVFGLISLANSESSDVPTFLGKPIQAVVSDSGLAASYIVRSTLQGQPYSSFLASYTWEDDTTRLQHSFGHYPQNDGSASADAMFRSMINRTDHDVLDPLSGERAKQRWWFGQLLEKAEAPGRFVYDWSTHATAGGFKLDLCGDHYQSNLAFRYHTHALKPELANRFFIASCSYSHLGGWLEGAFMSAINAVAGIVVAANRGNINALSLAAQPLLTALKPV
ncbi:MAG: hypothetical protein PW845_20510 [Pseudomonas sp.]|nr:hypothetical protein [Pseudomonas sp.]